MIFTIKNSSSITWLIIFSVHHTDSKPNEKNAWHNEKITIKIKFSFKIALSIEKESVKEVFKKEEEKKVRLEKEVHIQSKRSRANECSSSEIHVSSVCAVWTREKKKKMPNVNVI